MVWASTVTIASSLVEQDLGEELAVQLVDAVAVVHDLEAAHHEAGQVGLVATLQHLASGVVPRLLPQRVVQLCLRLESTLQCLDVFRVAERSLLFCTELD